MYEVVARKHALAAEATQCRGLLTQSSFLTMLGKESTMQPLLERRSAWLLPPRWFNLNKDVEPFKTPWPKRYPSHTRPISFLFIINSAPESKEGFRFGSPHPLQSLQIASPIKRGTSNTLSGPDLVTSKVFLENHGILWQKMAKSWILCKSHWILCCTTTR